MAEPAVVFGACGFLGRPLVQALAAQGREVIAMGRCAKAPALGPNVSWVSADLDQPASYRPHLRRGGTVFNLAAARSRVGTPSGVHRRVNVEATLALADACREAGVGRWLHVSSALAYGASSTPVEANGHLWTDAPSSYVRSRAACLLGVRERIAQGLPAVVVSPTIVFGPDSPSHPNRLTSHVRRLLRTGLSVSVGGGRARRNLVYVDDVVEGILLAERRAEVGQEVVLGGEDVSQAEFDALAWSLAGRRWRARLPVPSALAAAAARALDALRGYPRDSGYSEAVRNLALEWRFMSQAAERTLGYHWRPVADGLRRTLEFLGGAENGR